MCIFTQSFTVFRLVFTLYLSDSSTVLICPHYSIIPLIAAFQCIICCEISLVIEPHYPIIFSFLLFSFVCHVLCFVRFRSMGRLREVSHNDVLVVSSIERADSLNDPFVPNDFVEDGSNAMSLVVIFVLFSTFIFVFILSFNLLKFLFVDWIIF